MLSGPPGGPYGAAMDLELEYAAATHVGLVRGRNEDAHGRHATSLFVVADGMGGHAGGEVASAIAVAETVARYAASEERRRDLALDEALKGAHRAVRRRAEATPSLAGMGATVVALAFDRARAVVGHAGDSRCYLLRGGRLARLTTDHSAAEEARQKGRISFPYEAHVVTRAVGAGAGELRPEVRSLRPRAGDVFLLCTDGLTGPVPDAAIAEALRAPGPLEDVAADLIGRALDGGAPDNVTVALVRCR
jgi:serine/threonine protein phosphatase PrpC